MPSQDQKAFLARVTRVGASNSAGSGVVFHAALSETEESALAAMREAVKPGGYVEMTDGELSAETTRALALVPGRAGPM
jgi:hypothetical protein